ncbi:unnamed protein product [Macrosiphum euphorbiae]|uniref:Uncharacterized protein n=1 Tax=Macrosiphum euphorbiae TaxID=13131 RepID=A0AAV0WAE7_9HEMI|nr:unnamed protein product [Macrosiphum euphorbiae]
MTQIHVCPDLFRPRFLGNSQIQVGTDFLVIPRFRQAQISRRFPDSGTAQIHVCPDSGKPRFLVNSQIQEWPRFMYAQNYLGPDF